MHTCSCIGAHGVVCVLHSPFLNCIQCCFGALSHTRTHTQTDIRPNWRERAALRESVGVRARNREREGFRHVRICFDDRSLESSQSVVIERCLKSVVGCVCRAVVAPVAVLPSPFVVSVAHLLLVFSIRSCVRAAKIWASQQQLHLPTRPPFAFHSV